MVAYENLVQYGVPAVSALLGVVVTKWWDRRSASETNTNQAWHDFTQSLSARIESLTTRVQELETRQSKLERDLLNARSKYWVALEYIRMVLAWGHSLVLGHANLVEPECPESIREDLYPPGDEV